jgi:hypothetical protein
MVCAVSADVERRLAWAGAKRTIRGLRFVGPCKPSALTLNWALFLS